MLLSKSTATFQLAGGIGNQLFQFAAGLSYASISEKHLVFDISKIGSGTSKRTENIFDYFSVIGPDAINYSITSSSVPKFVDSVVYRFKPAAYLESKLRNVYSSPVIGFDENLYNASKSSHFRGYFQSHKYIDNLQELGMRISFRENEYSEAHANLLNHIDFQNDVAIHFRRGDYLNHSSTIGLLGSEYFRKALLHFKPNTRVYVFSDEDLLPTEFSQGSRFVRTPEMLAENSVETLSLLSKFENLIISNSTFSWWAASLGSESKNVVYPDPWFRSLMEPDALIPVGWTRIPSVWNIDYDA